MAATNPVEREVPGRRGKAVETISGQQGTFTIPDDANVESEESDQPRSQSARDEIQWMLLRLGNDMGLHVWIARNDRNRQVDGNRFAELPRLRRNLPLQFDDSATNRIIEHIDVLWLQGNAIVAAFEIESTISIYSGLLRMSDLVAMQPNLNIPLFIVAPDDPREKVIEEINRPTFVRRDPPLYAVCRYIPFTTLRDRFPILLEMGPYLKPEILDRISEDCSSETE
jgi:hypothetical protein